MDNPFEPSPDPSSFVRTVAHVQAYVRHEPGAWTALVDTARTDPQGTTASLLALGAVLLDLSAAAFELTPTDMLAKVSAGIHTHAASA